MFFMSSQILIPCKKEEKRVIQFFLQIILAMESRIIPFVAHLYPVLMKILQDEDGEVRGNCVYALGVLAAFGGDPVYVYPFFN